MAQVNNSVPIVSPETSSDEQRKATNRISLSATASHSPTIVPAPKSPTPSMHLDPESFSSEKEVVLDLPRTPDTPSSTRAIKSPKPEAPSSTRATKPSNPQDDTRELPRARRVSAIIATGGSWLDDASSSSEDDLPVDGEGAEEVLDEKEEGVIFAAARQAKRNRPRLIEHKNDSTGLLQRGGSLPRMPSASRDLITPHVNTTSNTIDVRERSVPVADTTANVDVSSEVADSLADLGMNRERQHSLRDALRSHPVNSMAVKRASTVPTQRKRAAFVPSLENVDTKKGRWERQSVISTPYPVDLRDGSSGGDWDLGSLEAVRHMESKRRKRNRDDRSLEMKEMPKRKPIDKTTASQALLTVVCYRTATPVPIVGKVSIPRIRKEGERKPSLESVETFPMRSKLKAIAEFDDQGLFNLLRTEYGRMRGSLLPFVSARSLKSIKLLSYNHLSQLASREDLVSIHTKRFRVLNEMFVEERLLRLYQTPSEGKGRRQWVEWVNSLPENAERESSSGEKVAVEFVEGWDGMRIALTVVTVVVASILAMFLWGFLGPGGHEVNISHGELSQEYVGYNGAGGRLVAGVVLGVLVLLVGWTGIGAWILLSWLH